MVETPGFAGVVWEARPAERLAQDFAAGPGSAPMVDAGRAWTALATEFAAGAVDYERILALLSGGWESGTGDAVRARMAQLRDWLAEAAEAAAANALRAHGQAAAYEVARLAMPDLGEMAALREAQRVLQSIGAALGMPLRAVGAEADETADTAKATAARVMRAYEAATEPIAQPWPQQPPPHIVAEAAPSPAAEPAGAAGMPSARNGLTTAAHAPALTGYRTATVAPAPAETVPVTSAARASATGSIPDGPAPMTPAGTAAAPQQEQAHEPRAAAAATFDADGDPAELDAGMRTAPAVLGGAEAAREVRP